MFKKARLFVLPLLCFSVNSYALETPNGRLGGMSNAGYATGGYSNGVLLNPSLGADNHSDDKVAWVMNAGAQVIDPVDMLDVAEELSDLLDRYYNNPISLRPEDGHLILERLRQLDGEKGHLNAGGSLLLAVPNKHLNVAAFMRRQASVGIHPDVDPHDLDIINDAINGIFSSDQLQSAITGRGLLTTEIGLALSRRIPVDANSHLLIGATPKRVNINTLVYETSIANFDEDDIDADRHRRDHQFFNLDVGVTYVRGAQRYGLSVQNIRSRTLNTVNTRHQVFIEPRATLAWGYQSERLTGEIAVDVNGVQDFAFWDKTQMLRAGIEFSALSWLNLRSGFNHDLQNNHPDTFSLGLGVSPFDVINIDITALKGSDNTYGGALQLGLHF